MTKLDQLNRKNNPKAVFGNVTIGLQLAITVLLFVYGGHVLDETVSMSPLFLSLGAAVGMGLGFYNLLRQVSRSSDNKRSGGNDKSNRWM